jgi:hypothetical protein
MLGRCKKECTQDYRSHYPNNYDCADYYEAHLFTFEVINPIKEKENKNALDRKIQTKEF